MSYVALLTRASLALVLASAVACGSDSGGGSGGADGGGGGGGADAQAGSDPFAADPTCSTDTYWTGGDRGSSVMHPGRACIQCHTQNFGPRLQLAGTVFLTGHEPDDCNGGAVDGNDVVVEVTDANQQVFTMFVNGAGNFYQRGGATVVFPITAKVTYQGRVRTMTTPAALGDCNSCHTQSGAQGAPGRIALP
jgi:hypothetical protein